MPENARPIAVLAAEIHLPKPVAIWVLFAHLATVLSPLAIIYAVSRHASYLNEVTYAPSLFYAAVPFMMIGGALEVAQNHIDRWYLTRDTGSAMSPGFCDMLFYTFGAIGLGLLGIACRGDMIWTWAFAVLCPVLIVALYLSGQDHNGPSGLLGIVVAYAFYRTFGEQAVFFMVTVGAPLTMVFFFLLLKTHAQWLHGFVALSNAVGLMAFPWSIHAGATQSSIGWVMMGGVSVATFALCGVLWKALQNLEATERKSPA